MNRSLFSPRLLSAAVLMGHALVSPWALAADPAGTAGAASAVSSDRQKDLKAPKSANIRFSHARGHYRQPFDLLLGPAEVSGEIRYTLDGSAPGKGRGMVYQKPIPITGTSLVRAAVLSPDGSVSRVQTHTYLFPADIARQSPDGLPPAGWPFEWGSNTVDYGMDPVVTEDPKYRDLLVPGLESLPAISLVMNLDDLFAPKRGIYANSDQEGRNWERPASIELLNPVGRKGFQEDCGVRIRGGFSSGGFNPKHGFRLFFRKEYGDGKLKYPIFGEGAVKEFDSLDLRCAQNYSWNIGGDPRGLFVRDQFSRDLQLAMGQPGARGNYCHLFLNGQYWGLYNTCERPEASYAAAYFGGKKEDYDVVKTGGIGGNNGGFSIAATDGTNEAWNRLHALAKEDLSDNAAYFRLLGRKADGSVDPEGTVLLDPTNLIDYLLVIWYGGNLDAPVTKFGGNRAPNNWHAIRNRHSRDGFKFFVWDAEHTLLDVEEDRTGPFPGGDSAESSHPQWLFQRCCANAEFRVLLADRIHRHLAGDGVLTVSSIRERFQRRIREIESAVVCESARWGDSGGNFPFGPPGMARPTRIGPDGEPKVFPRTRDVEWRAEVQRILEDFIPKRTEVVRFQLWRQGLVSDVPAAELIPTAGTLRAGEKLTVRASEGEVWYALGGEDPRVVGGAVSPKAVRAEVPITLSGSTTIQARVRSKGEWGPLVRGTFTIQ